MNIGAQIGDLLGGILNPIAGAATTLIGQGTTTTTVGADPGAASKSKNAFIAISVLGVILLIVVGIVVFKSNKS